MQARYEPHTPGVRAAYSALVDTSFESIWAESLTYAVRWLPDGSVLLDEQPGAPLQYGIRSLRVSAERTVLQTDGEAETRCEYALEMALMSKRSAMDRHPEVMPLVRAEWCAPRQGVVIYYEAPSVHVPLAKFISGRGLPTAPVRQADGTQSLPQTYETRRSVLFPNGQTREFRIETVYHPYTPSTPTTKQIFAMHADTLPPHKHHHLELTLTKTRFPTPFPSPKTPTHTGELSIVMRNTRSGRLRAAGAVSELGCLIMMVLLLDVGC